MMPPSGGGSPYGGGPMVPPSGAGNPYGGGPMVMQQGAGAMPMAGGAVYYAPIVVMAMPGRAPRGRAVHPEWNPQMDAQRLRKAIKGVGNC
jgi:hypothetical protein